MHFGNWILLVEDLKADELLLFNAMKHSGLRNPLMVVHDGVAAVNYLEGRGRFANRQSFPLPEVLLLDLGLPKMSGWDVLHWVRSNHRFAHVLVVVLTASLEVSDLQRAYQMGANSFLTKPCQPVDLLRLAKAFPERWFGTLDPPQDLKALLMEDPGP